MGDVTIDVAEVDKVPRTTLEQFKGAFVAARTALLGIEHKEKAPGLRNDFHNEVMRALKGIAEGASNSKEEQYLMFTKLDYHADAVLAIARAFGGDISNEEVPNGQALARYIMNLLEAQSPSGEYKNSIDVPSAFEGIDLRLFSGQSGGFGVGLILKPEGVGRLYQDMQKAGYTDPSGGTNRLLQDFAPQYSVITAAAG